MNWQSSLYLARTIILKYVVRQTMLLAAILLSVPVGVWAGMDAWAYEDSYTTVAGILGAGQEVVIAHNNSSIEKSFVDAYSLKTGRLVWRRHMRAPLAQGMCISESKLYVPTVTDGTYSLHLKSGRILAHFTRENYDSPGGIACRSGLAIIAGGQDESVLIGAFRQPSFRLEWERSIPKSYIWALSAKGSNVEVLVSDIYRYHDIVLHDPRFEKLLIRVKDGKILSRTTATDLREGVPKTLPKPVQKGLTRLLKSEDSYMDRTRIEHLGNLWYVGRFQQDTVTALNGNTGKIVWSRGFPGVADIKICGKSLIVAALQVGDWGWKGMPSRANAPGKLVSLDAETGRVQWAVRVPVR